MRLKPSKESSVIEHKETTMSSQDLHKGVFMRQILKGKRKIRIAFLSDDPEVQPESTIRPHDIGEKTSWRKLYEKDNPDPASVTDLDVDAGVVILRLNPDLASGTVAFFPADKTKPVLVNKFKPGLADPPIPGASPVDFAQCMSNKISGGMKAVEAIATCLPELPK
jgi:hypothetical protein